ALRAISLAPTTWRLRLSLWPTSDMRASSASMSFRTVIPSLVPYAIVRMSSSGSTGIVMSTTECDSFFLFFHLKRKIKELRTGFSEESKALEVDLQHEGVVQPLHPAPEHRPPAPEVIR